MLELFKGTPNIEFAARNIPQMDDVEAALNLFLEFFNQLYIVPLVFRVQHVSSFVDAREVAAPLCKIQAVRTRRKFSRHTGAQALIIQENQPGLLIWI